MKATAFEKEAFKAARLYQAARWSLESWAQAARALAKENEDLKAQVRALQSGQLKESTEAIRQGTGAVIEVTRHSRDLRQTRGERDHWHRRNQEANQLVSLALEERDVFKAALKEVERFAAQALTKALDETSAKALKAVQATQAEATQAAQAYQAPGRATASEGSGLRDRSRCAPHSVFEWCAACINSTEETQRQRVKVPT